MVDIGGVPQLPWEHFKSYLPEPCVDIPTIRATLECSGVIKDDRWSAYPVDPSAIPEKEDTVCKGLDGIFDAIVEQCHGNSLGRTQILMRTQNPQQTPISDERTNISRPDGAFTLMDSPYDWGRIGASEERKTQKSRKDEYDNIRKIIWSLHHVMRDDPCRRFTYGVTIEDTQMRLWFCNRSGMIVLEAFNFVTDVEKVIHIYASFAFATPAEMGWDPTIRAIPNTSPTEYDISVHSDDQTRPTVYHSARLIWDSAAEEMHGPATRIFEAVDPATGRNIAIKDAWRDHKRESEGASVRMVMGKLDNLGERGQPFKKYFMDVLEYGDVQVDGQPDDTLKLGMRGMPLPEKYGVLSLLRPARTTEEATGNHPIVADLELAFDIRARPDFEYRHRVHHRVVFADVGTPIHDLVRLKDRAQALVDSLKGHKALCDMGYVHRDISVGNILWTKTLDGKMVGKLTDLEYLLAIDSDEKARSTRTGTMDFMSIEVDSMTYHFRPDDVENDSDDDAIYWEPLTRDAHVPPDNIKSGGTPAKPDTTIAFRHNPLNDIESYWWIMSWNIFAHLPTSLRLPPANEELSPSSTDSWSVKAQSHVAEKMFPGTLGSFHRAEIFEKRATFLHDAEVLPAELKPFVQPLELARKRLVKAYRKAENPSKCIDQRAFLQIHGPFIKLFEHIVDQAGDIELRSLSSAFSFSAAKSTGKRTAGGPAGERRSKRRKVE
ncbi:hypothetical protein PLICRDRAFT_172541 [Plicaturopsis crispa FD-325 SS-3]|nr:hypothetical protein PLICRDRAFT_172541 [Plicaturopsis crispa FD-325 SS-3]